MVIARRWSRSGRTAPTLAPFTPLGVECSDGRRLGLGARLDAGSWEEPAVFGLIRSLGGVPESEMRGVFNLGVGFCAVVPSEEAAAGLEALYEPGCDAWRIGEVTEAGGVEFV